MNVWTGVGRLVKDVETRYNGEMCVSKFTIAIDDGYGDKKKTDFIPIVCFGKTAESCEKFLEKGKMCAVSGKYHTDSYDNKEGKKVYTTDIIANRVDFLSPKDESKKESKSEVPEGFMEIEDDGSLPF